MKILFVNNAKMCSGAEEHLIDLAHEMVKNGDEPVFLTRRGWHFYDRLLNEGFIVHSVMRDGLKKLSSLWDTVRIIRQEQPDVISVNREHDLYITYAAALCARLFNMRKPKLAAVFHTPNSRKYPILNQFDGIVCTSHYTAETFAKVNPSIRGRIAVIHYGIELPEPRIKEKLNKNRPRFFFPERQFPIIGMAGELWKNQEELVEATRILQKFYPDITVAIVGSGYQSTIDRLTAMIRNYGLEKNVILTGRVPRSDMSQIFFDFDLSVSTHRNEGFGIVHIESLAALTPVVAYNSGGLVEILHKGGGHLVDGETAEFAQAILDLLHDDTRREQLGREGRAVVEEHFSIAAMCDSHRQFYRKLICQ